jgi:catechol 2,3-dioxygenase
MSSNNLNKQIKPINHSVKIGHVHLKVANIDRSLDFYCGVLGFELKQRVGNQVAFIAAGDYHHHIGLNTWESGGGMPPPAGTTGLYHLAILYPERKELADAFMRLQKNNLPLNGASDHGVSEALYLDDPDKNGIELYWDKPKELWPYDNNNQLQMFTQALDLKSLMAEID